MLDGTKMGAMSLVSEMAMALLRGGGLFEDGYSALFLTLMHKCPDLVIAPLVPVSDFVSSLAL